MSMLLDAVQRQRAHQSPQDPAFAAMLPTIEKKASLPWHWLLPPAALLASAACGWFVVQQQQQQQQGPIASKPSVVANSTAVATSVNRSVQLGPKVLMPTPVASVAPIVTVRASQDNGVVVAKEERPVVMPTTSTVAKQSRTSSNADSPNLPKPEPSSEPEVDQQLLAALEQAFADVGGVEPQQQQQQQTALDELLSQQSTEVGTETKIGTDNEIAPETVIDAKPSQYQQVEESLDSLSPEMQLALDQALAKAGMAPMPAPTKSNQPKVVPKLGQMPWSFQKQLPDLEVTAHVYATDAEKRWLRANGRELQEGDEAAPGLVVKEILPNEIILEMDSQAFRIPALGSI